MAKSRIKRLAILLVIGCVAIGFVIGGFLETGWQIGSPQVAARVGHQTITRADLSHITRAEQRQSDPVDFGSLQERVREALIQEAVLRQYLDARGFRVGKSALIYKIQAFPGFQEAGVFSPKKYEAFLTKAKLEQQFRSEQALLEAVRVQTLQEQWGLGIMRSSLLLPREWQRIHDLLYEGRSGMIGTWTHAALQQQITVKDSEIQTYFEAHPDAFPWPEKVRCAYVMLAPEQWKTPLPAPKKSAIQQYYATHPEGFQLPERRHLAHILFTAQPGETPEALHARAEAVRETLVAGADFATVARRESQDPGSAADGGDLGWAPVDTYVPAFEAAAGALKKPGDLSPVVDTPFGVHIIRLEAHTPASVRPLDAARAEIVTYLEQEAIDQKMAELEQQLAALLAVPGTDLAAVAQALGLSVHHTEWVDRAGGGLPSGLLRWDVPAMMEAAFTPTVLAGHLSPAMRLDPRHLLVLQGEGHTPARAKTLQEAAPEIREILLQERVQAWVETRLARLRTHMEKNMADPGDSVIRMARSMGLVFKPFRQERRPGFETRAGISDALRADIFAAPDPRYAEGPVLERRVDPTGFHVIWVRKAEVLAPVFPPLPADPDQTPQDPSEKPAAQRKRQAAAQQEHETRELARQRTVFRELWGITELQALKQIQEQEIGVKRMKLEETFE